MRNYVYAEGFLYFFFYIYIALDSIYLADNIKSTYVALLVNIILMIVEFIKIFSDPKKYFSRQSKVVDFVGQSILIFYYSHKIYVGKDDFNEFIEYLQALSILLLLLYRALA